MLGLFKKNTPDSYRNYSYSQSGEDIIVYRILKRLNIQNVMLAGGNHAIDDIDVPMILSSKGTNKGIVLEDDVWIGANAVVVDGVTICRGAVVGGGSGRN